MVGEPSDADAPDRSPDRPWEPERTRTCVRGRVLVKVAPGGGPEHVPHYLEVARGVHPASLSIDGGPIDTAIRKFSPAAQVTRAFHAARQITVGGETRHQWD